MAEFSIDINRLNGYPSITDITTDFSPVQSSPYPSRFMTINSSYLNSYPSVGLSFSPVQSSPYPLMVFNVNSLYLNSYPSVGLSFSPVQTFPYPNLLISATTGYLSGYPSLRKHFIKPGAFKNLENLTSVTISSDVDCIQDYTFWNTSITSVTLGNNCIYYPHSFPTGCTVTGGILKTVGYDS